MNKIIIDFIEDHARQEANHEKKNLESVVPLMQIRIKQISGSMMIKHLSHLDILYLQTRPLTMSFVYVNQII
jgi:hypothetical protein